MVIRKAQLKRGETVLVHSAGSGVSQFAIQIAKALGAQVITTVSSPEKAERAKKLGADHVIQTNESPLRGQLKSILGPQKRGVDVVIEHIGGKVFEQSLGCLKRGGRLVTCGATSGPMVQINLNLVFFKNISILGNTMGGAHDLDDLISWVVDQKVQPVLDREFSMAEYPQALDYLESRRAFGKVVMLT